MASRTKMIAIKRAAFHEAVAHPRFACPLVIFCL
jgi:hypothetical protein